MQESRSLATPSRRGSCLSPLQETPKLAQRWGHRRSSCCTSSKAARIRLVEFTMRQKLGALALHPTDSIKHRVNLGWYNYFAQVLAANLGKRVHNDAVLAWLLHDDRLDAEARSENQHLMLGMFLSKSSNNSSSNQDLNIYLRKALRAKRAQLPRVCTSRCLYLKLFEDQVTRPSVQGCAVFTVVLDDSDVQTLQTSKML